jgi:hypothetical protein
MVHDQLIIERLHLRIKRPGEKVDNLRRWERSVLAEALNHQVQDLQLLRGPCHVMDNRVTRSDEFPDALFCNNIRVMGMHLSAGDVVFWRDHAGKIMICSEDIKQKNKNKATQATTSKHTNNTTQTDRQQKLKRKTNTHTHTRTRTHTNKLKHEEAGKFFIIFERWEFVRAMTSTASVWRETRRRREVVDSKQKN